MGKRVNVKSEGNVVTKVETPIKKSLGKETVVNGRSYASRSEAIRSLLADGMRKADIARAIGASYSFVQTIAGRSDFDYSVIKERAKADKAHDKMLSERNKKIGSIPAMKEKLEKLLTKKIDLDAQIESLMSEIQHAEDIFHLINVFPLPSVNDLEEVA